MTAAFERFRGKRGLVIGLGLFGGGTEAAAGIRGWLSPVPDGAGFCS